jgi:hypothetical protein
MDLCEVQFHLLCLFLRSLPHAAADFTAATILDKFQNQNTAQSVEHVLKKLAAKKEIVAVGSLSSSLFQAGS